MPRRHFNSYFFSHEVVVILLAVRLFFLPWGFSFCHEVNSFAMTVMGHRTCENKAFKMQHSVTVVCPLFDDLISSPVSPFSAWSTLHYERHNNVRRNESSSSENPLGMTNIEHTPMKGKWCSFLIWCLQSGVISSLNLYLSIRVC